MSKKLFNIYFWLLVVCFLSLVLQGCSGLTRFQQEVTLDQAENDRVGSKTDGQHRVREYKLSKKYIYSQYPVDLDTGLGTRSAYVYNVTNELATFEIYKTSGWWNTKIHTITLHGMSDYEFRLPVGKFRIVCLSGGTQQWEVVRKVTNAPNIAPNGREYGLSFGTQYYHGRGRLSSWKE